MSRALRAVPLFVSAGVAGLLIGSGLSIVSVPGLGAAASAAAPVVADVTSRPDSVSTMLSARVTGHRVEDTSQETAYGHTYANPDGTWTTDEYAGPVQVQDGQGAWEAIDPTLATTKDGSIEPAVSAADVVFGGGGSTKLATMTVDGKPVTWTWPSILPAPMIDGPTATYQIGDGEQLVLTATSTGFSQDIVLTKAPPAVWQLPTPTISGTAGSVTSNGSMTFADPSGKALVTSSAPFAFDSSKNAGGEPAVSPLAAALTHITATKQKLSLTPVASFLAAKSTVYPVTIDPSYSTTAQPSVDTWVQSPGYTSSQYNSTELKAGTYDGGTDVARTFIKFGGTTWTGKNITSAQFRIRNWYSSSCTGSAVRVAEVTDSWSQTGISWNNQPNWTTTSHSDLTTAHGYNSTCGAADAVWDVTGIAQDWAGGAAVNGIVIKGLNEADSNTWRRYRSTEYGDPTLAPRITYTYDSYPNTPGTPSVTTSPASSAGYVNTLTPTLSATVSDPDGGNVDAQFKIYQGSTLVATTGWSPYVASGKTASIAVPSGVLANGTTYTVNAWAGDGSTGSKVWSASTTFKTAVGTPPTPTVNCPSAAAGSWPDTVPSSPVACTIGVTGTGGSAPVSVTYSIDGASTTKSVTSPTTVTGLSVANKAGGHTIKASVTSASGVASATATYSFGYGALALTTPGASPVVQSTGVITIGATGPPGPSGSGLPTPYLQWRIAGSGGDATTGWTKDTAASLTASSTGDGGIAVKGAWNIADVVASGTGNDSRLPHLVDLEVCATYTSGTQCSWTSHPVTVMYEAHAFGAGFPTIDVPDGEAALWTGEFATAGTDATLNAGTTTLSVSRSDATFDGAPSSPAAGVFGPGWTASLDGPSGGEAGAQVVDDTPNSGAIAIVAGDADPLVYTPVDPNKGTSFRRTGATFTTGSWVAADAETEASGVVATVKGTGANTQLVLTDPDGTITTFGVSAAPSTGVPATFQTLSVTEPGSQTTSYSYDSAGRVTRMLAPAPAGVTCPAPSTTSGLATAQPNMPAGCRALWLTYATATTAASGTPGDYAGQLQSISSLIGAGTGSANDTTTLAAYGYNISGRLVSVTDHPASVNLTTTYSYDSAGRIASITPPGQTPINYAYNGSNRLVQVTRAEDSSDAPSGTADLATIVYGAPVAGSAATGVGLPDLSSAAVGAWNQSDAPTGAVAVFGPDRNLSAGATPSSSDWPYATVYYTDAEGYGVNTATNGAGQWQLTDTEYDQQGNPVRELSAADIGAVKSGALTPAQAGTLTVYNSEVVDANGAVILPAETEVTDTYATARSVTLADGTSQLLRPHTHTTYDEQAPNSDLDPATGQRYALPTTVTQGAADPSGVATDAGSTEPADVEIDSLTHADYAGAVPGDTTNLGWSMGLASKTTEVMDNSVAGGAAGATPIISRTYYNSAGQVIETLQPNSTGADAGTRQSIYYTAGSSSAVGTGAGSTPDVAACDSHPEWAGLLCQTRFAGNPANGPSMITTTEAYNNLQEVNGTTETSTATDGTAVTRTTKTTYDGAGRPATLHIATAGLAGSASVPDTTYGYDASTGLPTTTTPATGSPITVGYDAWGRQHTYTTGAGATTTSYNAAGQVASTTDGAGTVTTYTYNGNDANGAVEHRGLVTSQTSTAAAAHGGATLTIAAGYDADGNLLNESLPGGVSVSNTYDTAGELTGRTYSGDGTDSNGNPAKNTAWESWTQAFDALGQIVGSTAPAAGGGTGDINYGYDPSSRLTNVQDGTTGACVSRNYVFDADGNRTKLTTNPAAANGSCQSGASVAGAASQSWTYNTADRLTAASDGSAYAYDALGRTVTLPQVDSPAGTAYGINTNHGLSATAPGQVSAAYYDTDTVHTLTQNGQTTTYSLDASGRPVTEATGPTTGAPTSTLSLGYADGSDSPAWETTANASNGSWEGYVTGPDGLLVATLTSTAAGVTGSTTGAAQLAVVNPHGDTVSQTTLPASGDPAGVDSWTATDEFGNAISLNPNTALSASATGTNPGNTSATDGKGGLGYGWTGANQRATSETGIVLMGARLYNPTTGRFLSVDPIYGGNANAYNYPLDPIDGLDLTGLEEIDAAGGYVFEGIGEESEATAGEAAEGGRGGSTGKNPVRYTIPQLSKSEIESIARGQGYVRTSRSTKRGGAIWFNKSQGTYITRDRSDGGSSHSGGTWKMATSVKNLHSKTTRMGTYDAHFVRIGD